MQMQEKTGDSLRFLKAIWKPGDVREIRAFDKDQNTYFGYFDTPETAEAACLSLEKTHTIYVTLNPCNPALLARCANRIKRAGKKDSLTTDKDIIELRYQLFDCDPKRPAGISSTQEEKAKALNLIQELEKELGTPYIKGDSGNGYHMLYGHDAKVPEQLKVYLAYLNEKYGKDGVSIDTAVYNPSRITKVLGTWARKGDNTGDRPHRRSGISQIQSDAPILHIPPLPEPTPKPVPVTTPKQSQFDVRAFLAAHNVGISKEKILDGGRTMLILAGGCVFDPGHTEGEAAICLHDSGLITYQCFHDSCKGKTWEDFRSLIGAPKKDPKRLCKTCGREVHWIQENEKWVLYEGNDRHFCNKKNNVIVEEPEPAPQAQIPKIAFPIDVYPDWLRDFCVGVADSICCPVDFPAVAALATTSIAMGKKKSIQIKPDWVEKARLYLAIVGPPSSAKTPAMLKVLAPVFQIEESCKNTNEVLDVTYENQKLDYEVRKEVWKKEKRAGSQAQPPEKPEPPKHKRIYTSDYTVEALGPILADDNDILLYQDELTEWISSMNQYKGGHGKDREFFLKQWSGTACPIDRKGGDKKTIYINDPYISVVGGIVPENLTMLRGQVHDGFIDRILFSYPETMKRHWSDYSVPFDVRDRYMAEIQNIYHQPQGVVFLDNDVRLQFAIWYDHLSGLIHETPNPWIEGAYGKLLGYTARLLLVLTTLHNLPQATTVTLEGAVQLTQYFMDNAQKVFANLEMTEEQKEIMSILNYAKKRNQATITVRELCRACVPGCETAPVTRAKLSIMVKVGMAKWVVEGKEIQILEENHVG